jgi:pteridine reductase
MKEYPLALITGGTHRLGRIFALTMARRGFAILLHYYHSSTFASSTADEIRAMGIPVYPIQADLTDSIQLQGIFSWIDTHDFRLEVLINSASEMIREDLKTISPEKWDSTIDLNLRAPLFLAQHSAQRMNRNGNIINITDAGAGRSWTNYPAYTISKSGLELLTRIQAKVFAPGIRVNAIAPGLVLPSASVSTEEWDKLVNRLPLKRQVSLKDVTGALEFILDNDSITGQTIIVDGGYSIT